MALTDLEHAALSGELFQPRSNSPTRSDSTSSPFNTDDELASDLDDEGTGTGGFVSRRGRRVAGGQEGDSTTALIEPSNGPRTGIKGVLNDQKAYSAHSKSVIADRAREIRDRMEKTSITVNGTQSTKTIAGAGADAGAGVGAGADDGPEGWRKRRMMEFELTKKGLKEVGKQGFLNAVERSGWVLVLIYEPVCPTLSSKLFRLHCRRRRRRRGA